MNHTAFFAKYLLATLLFNLTPAHATNIAISAQQSKIEFPRFEDSEALTTNGYAVSIGHSFSESFSISASYQTDDIDETHRTQRWQGQAEQQGYDLRLNWQWHDYSLSVGYQNHESELLSLQAISLASVVSNARFIYQEELASDQFSFHAAKDFDFENSWLTLESGLIYSEQDAVYMEEITAIRNAVPFSQISDTQETSESWLFNLSGYWSYPIIYDGFEAITSLGLSWYQVVTGDDVYLLESFQGRRSRANANTITDKVIEPTSQDHSINASLAFMWLVTDQLSIDVSYQFDVEDMTNSALINLGASWQF